MKLFKRISMVLVLSLVITLIAPGFVYGNTAKVEAAVKLSKRKLTITAGDTATLKISGTTKTVKWSTDKKAVATVNQKGKVTAKKAGTAKITATVEGKSYTCTVTVKANALITKAPFNAKQTSLGKVNFVIPKEYSSMSAENAYGSAIYYPSANDIETNANCVAVTAVETGESATKYDMLESTYTAYYESALGSIGVDYEINKHKTKNGTALVVSYSMEVENVTLNYSIYLLSIDNYLMEIDVISQKGAKASPAVKVVGEYILDSITVK